MYLYVYIYTYIHIYTYLLLFVDIIMYLGSMTPNKGPQATVLFQPAREMISQSRAICSMCDTNVSFMTCQEFMNSLTMLNH